MKIIKFLPFLTILISNVSCSNSSKIHIFKNADKELIVLNTTNLRNYIEGNISSLIYVGSSTCSSCATIENNLLEYLEEKTGLILKYDVALNFDYQTLFNDYPNIFNNSYPQLIAFDSKSKFINISLSGCDDYNKFKSALNINIELANTTFLHKKGTYLEKQLELDEIFLSCVDSSKLSSLTTYSNIIKPISNSSNKISYFVDNNIDDEIKTYLKSEYQIQYDEFSFHIKTNELIYNSCSFLDENALKEFVNKSLI